MRHFDDSRSIVSSSSSEMLGRFIRLIFSRIICRTFQGIGGAGVYALAVLITYEMVPKEKLPLYGGLNSLAVAIATLMGPICGGLINNYTTWRWVFYLKYAGARKC